MRTRDDAPDTAEPDGAAAAARPAAQAGADTAPRSAAEQPAPAGAGPDTGGDTAPRSAAGPEAPAEAGAVVGTEPEAGPGTGAGPDDSGTGPAADADAEPAPGDGDGDSDGPDGRAPGSAAPPRRRWRLYAVLATVVALLAAGAVLLFQERQLRGTPAAENRALTDADTTAGVTGDVSNALTEIFSYTPTDTARTRAAAGELLAGRAARQYTGLFAQVEKEAARQKVTLTTHVVRAGVTRLSGDSARLLVFLDQVSERPGKEPATAPAQLSVTAELHDGRWRITDIASR
ncbi:hypothetical protein ACFU9F_02600 [Streptomyces zhihengii]|uniref:hypothetical protein n=1 Tax=Streptomyces zhihengii TaxID=1818004 RepID=UPI0036BF293A